MNSAPEIFENRDRKVDEDINKFEKDHKVQRLKGVMAEITHENVELKKRLKNACRGENGQIKVLSHTDISGNKGCRDK